jgi:hypothetical protein
MLCKPRGATSKPLATQAGLLARSTLTAYAPWIPHSLLVCLSAPPKLAPSISPPIYPLRTPYGRCYQTERAAAVLQLSWQGVPSVASSLSWLSFPPPLCREKGTQSQLSRGAPHRGPIHLYSTLPSHSTSMTIPPEAIVKPQGFLAGGFPPRGQQEGTIT